MPMTYDELGNVVSPSSVDEGYAGPASPLNTLLAQYGYTGPMGAAGNSPSGAILSQAQLYNNPSLNQGDWAGLQADPAFAPYASLLRLASPTDLSNLENQDVMGNGAGKGSMKEGILTTLQAIAAMYGAGQGISALGGAPVTPEIPPSSVGYGGTGYSVPGGASSPLNPLQYSTVPSTYGANPLLGGSPVYPALGGTAGAVGALSDLGSGGTQSFEEAASTVPAAGPIGPELQLPAEVVDATMKPLSLAQMVQNGSSPQAILSALTGGNPLATTFGNAASTGAMPWGSPGNLFSLGTSLYGLYQSNKLKQLAQMAMQGADPWGASGGRSLADSRLQALLRDPSSITSMPGYDAGLQAVQRSLAANGYLGSGNMMAALQKYGGDFYNNAVSQLSGLSGATINPGTAASIGLQGQLGGANLALNSLGLLGKTAQMAQ